MYAKKKDSYKNKPIRPEKPKSTRAVKDTLLIYGGGFLLTVLAFFITFQFVEPAPPKSITIATGDSSGSYYQYALEFREALAEHGIELKILETQGSIENLSMLSGDNPAAELAFVQSGTGRDFYGQGVMGLGSVYREPLWLFSNGGVLNGRLSALKGKRVAVGGEGSGTRALFVRMLEANDLSGQVELDDRNGDAALAALKAGEIDVLATVSSYRAPLVQALIADTSLQLLPFVRADAYSRHFPYLSHVSLSEGALDLTHNIPPRHIDLLAPAATLVANDHLHPAISDLIMQISSSLFAPAGILSTAGEFPSEKYLEFPLSPEAKRFYKSGPPFLQRYLPFWAATLVDRLKVLLLPLFALMLPLSKILPPTYRWSVRKKIFKWYDELQLIDQSATETPTEDNLEHCLANLDVMEKEVRAVEVPLGYANELYVLRQHIDLLARQIGVREQILERERLEAGSATKHQSV
ncbi:TAXI family TRAP transporter solute-binding subunit [Granulosicoccaceae sp. 1_MG-2023]|nr:TAXI family TRAP transporter solute-binding subunit [Granulosicoccaceae sp. 1_MG-2023]